MSDDREHWCEYCPLWSDHGHCRNCGRRFEGPSDAAPPPPEVPAGAEVAEVLGGLVKEMREMAAHQRGLGLDDYAAGFEFAGLLVEAAQRQAAIEARAAGGETLAHRLSRSGSSGYVKVGAGLAQTIAEAERALERGEVSTLDEVVPPMAPPVAPPDAEVNAAIRAGGAEPVTDADLDDDTCAHREGLARLWGQHRDLCKIYQTCLKALHAAESELKRAAAPPAPVALGVAELLAACDRAERGHPAGHRLTTRAIRHYLGPGGPDGTEDET